MKKLFIFLNILLTSCVGWLIYTHISYTPAPPEKALEMTPAEPSYARTGIFDRENSQMPGDLSYIYENNIFLPNRGVQEEVVGVDGELSSGTESITKPYTGTFELAGICKIDDMEGALITSTGSKRTASLRAKFYRVDEVIADTGYKLIEVSSAKGSVLIGNGRQESVLELDRNDPGSAQRRDLEVKKQELAAKKAEIAFKKSMGPGVGANSNVQGPGIGPNTSTPVTPPADPKKKSAEEIAAIRKKILERMAEDKKKKNKDNNTSNGSFGARSGTSRRR